MKGRDLLGCAFKKRLDLSHTCVRDTNVKVRPELLNGLLNGVVYSLGVSDIYHTDHSIQMDPSKNSISTHQYER